MAQTANSVQIAPTLDAWIEEQILTNPELKRQLERSEEETSAEIIACANKFLEQSAETIENYNKVNTYLRKLYKVRKSIQAQMGKDADYKEVEEYKTLQLEFEQTGLQKTVILDLYKQLNEFQVELNRFLGQEIQYIFVEQDDEGNPVMFKVNEEDLLTPDEASKGMGLVARFTKRASSLLNDTQAAVEKVTFLEGAVNNIDVLNHIYKSVIYKIENYKVTGPSGKQTSLVLWPNPDPPPKWGMMFIQNKGDVGEAYAAAALKDEILQKFGQLDARTYDEFMHLVADVDNISGLLQGDVRDGQIEYAIKSAGASALGVKQIVSLAKKISKDGAEGKLFDTRKLVAQQYKLAKKGKVRNHIDYVEEQVIKSLRQQGLEEYQMGITISI